MLRRTRNTALAAAVASLLAAPAQLDAQSSEQFVLRGDDVAVYNLAGQLRIVPGDGGDVVVELERRGSDGSDLRVEVGPLDGRETLRVVYPADRIVYSEMSRGSRTRLRVARDGTFDRGGRGNVVITGSGRGLEAHADIVVRVPRGGRAAVHLAVGQVAIREVEGDLHVRTSSARVEAERHRGALTMDAGSGSLRVSDVEGPLRWSGGSGSVRLEDVRGDMEVEIGSGSLTAQGLGGETVRLSTGSGSVRIEDVEARQFAARAGSGSVRAREIEAGEARLSTGSGSMQLDRLRVGRLAAQTGSGRLRGSEVAAAELTMSTGSGGIDLADVITDRVEMESRSGSLRLGLLNAAPTGRLSAGSGSVTVSLPAGADLELDVNARGGIRVDAPASVIEQVSGRYRGRLGAGTGRLEIRTGSGGVRVSQR